MAKIPENRLQIGDKVLVDYVVEFGHHREYDDAGNPIGLLERRMFRSRIVPTEMIIVGGTFHKLGVVHPIRPVYSLDGTEVGLGHLKITNQVFVYHVRRGFMRKIQEALPEDVSCLK
jgi:hypothetical protein